MNRAPLHGRWVNRVHHVLNLHSVQPQDLCSEECVDSTTSALVTVTGSWTLYSVVKSFHVTAVFYALAKP